MRISLILCLCLGALQPSCARQLDRLDGDRSTAVTTGGPWASMIFLARSSGGEVFAIDLGSDPDGEALYRGLDSLDAAPRDVRTVFLTHSHRDHLAAWPVVRAAEFVLGAPESPLLFGERAHRAPWVDAMDRLLPPRLPEPRDVTVRTFSVDTAWVVGGDTVHAFLVGGHTMGSAAYLWRGVLFVGDVITYTPIVGFHLGRRVFSDDLDRLRAGVRSLRARVEPYGPLTICTGHGRCGPAREVFLEVLGLPADSVGDGSERLPAPLRPL